MALDYINTKLTELRDQANTARGRSNELKEAIKADPRYSPEHKQQLINEEKDRLQETMVGLREQEAKLVEEKIDSINRTLSATSGTSSADLIAHRDAQERADRLEGEGEALRALERAINSDDKSLAYAVLRRGSEVGWPRVLERGAEKYPLALESFNDLAALHNFMNNTGAILEREMTYGVF